MNFKDMVAADIKKVFLNSSEFGEIRSVKYDGETYSNIPIVLSGLKEKDRRQLVVSDRIQGLYLVTAVLHCAVSDLDGKLPEKGMDIKISDADGYFNEYRVSSSSLEMSVVRVELGEISE